VTVGSWVRHVAGGMGSGQVVAISRDLRSVWVRWPKIGVRMHAPEELEVIEETKQS
jgi:hypothetical protein